jgi:hypothetical protein
LVLVIKCQTVSSGLRFFRTSDVLATAVIPIDSSRRQWNYPTFSGRLSAYPSSLAGTLALLMMVPEFCSLALRVVEWN